MYLKNTHLGWQNEHLARYLLSKVAFITSPTMPGDDVGVDLVCTLYELGKSAKVAKVLVPKNAIAIQVKSSRRVWNFTKKVSYLQRLEIPFFVAVVSQKDLCIDLYSGKYLTHFFSFRGSPNKLHLSPVDELTTHYRKGDDKAGYCIKLPRICQLKAGASEAENEANRLSIFQESMAAQKAIASRQNREFIFDIVDGIEIFTGKDSVKGFMDNYILRLAEALYNIAWKLENKITFNIDDEKEYFLETYYRFSERFNVPDHLTKAYEQLMAASGDSD